MKRQESRYQLLGCHRNWICVIHDLIKDFDPDVSITIIPNIEMEIYLNDCCQKIDFQVRSPEEYDPGLPVFFGLTGPRNKLPVYKSFESLVSKQEYMNVISDNAKISQSSILSTGILLDYSCVVSAQTSIDFAVTVKRGSCIGHHNKIGAFSDINPGVTTSGNVTIGRGCEIGTGALIRDGVTIGDNCLIGMGSVVTRDIPANSVAYGSPCKVVKENPAFDFG